MIFRMAETLKTIEQLETDPYDNSWIEEQERKSREFQARIIRQHFEVKGPRNVAVNQSRRAFKKRSA